MSKNAEIGEKIDLTALDPTLQRVVVAAGWESDLNEENEPLVDVDLSLFLLNRADMTRDDQDFVFYNNPAAEGGAVSHTGAQKTGGTGNDQETLLVDLNGLNFDIEKVMIVLSVYNSADNGAHFGMVKNKYLRVINRDTSQEMLKFDLPDTNEGDQPIGLKVALIERDGVNWYFTGMNDSIKGGLGKIAQEYGMLVQGS